MKQIIIKGANEGNLKNISLEIPREKLVVLTGLSGSGKSTLAIEVLFQESQRLYLEAMALQGIHKPDVVSIENVSPAIMISQHSYNKNPRSTLGTNTNIYTDLRMIYEKVGERVCPHCHKSIKNHECREEFVKEDKDYQVFMYCSHCNGRMKKLTRTDFSYNTKEGACPTCVGLGKVLSLNEEKVVKQEVSLEEGAISLWQHAYKDYQINILYKAFAYYGESIEPNIKVKDFTKKQKALLFYGAESKEVKELFPTIDAPKGVSQGKFEGIFTMLWRRISEHKGILKGYEEFFSEGSCPDCKGERLSTLSREVVVANKRLPELTIMSLDELYDWVVALEKETDKSNEAMIYLLDLKTKIKRIIRLGLGYLSIDRQAMTLSGGEVQRIKLAATLDSSLTGILYIMDEPTIGLHPKDTVGIIEVLKQLRDLGNTVIIIEHDPTVMKEADYIIDIGPGSGKFGGEIVGKGSFEDLFQQESSITGQYFKNKRVVKTAYRKKTDKGIIIKQATLHNLKQVNVTIPIDCLVSVTGVSGSGKSTLVFDVLGRQYGNIEGLDVFDKMIAIEQTQVARMRRSNVATYSGLYVHIRKLFGNLKEALEQGLSMKEFSFNTKGGRCEHCQGLGFVTSNMLFFEDAEVVCPVCEGQQFKDTVLSVTYKGYNIHEILQLSIDEVAEVFKNYKTMMKILQLLKNVGLGYLQLGQSLTTLSGGEGQRLKLAKELIGSEGKRNLYLIDEPTIGLHPIDVEVFLVLLNRLVDAGNTVIVVEHNEQIIEASDWVIDLGPEGGINGGKIIAEGTPLMLQANESSVTGQYLKK